MPNYDFKIYGKNIIKNDIIAHSINFVVNLTISSLNVKFGNISLRGGLRTEVFNSNS